MRKAFSFKAKVHEEKLNATVGLCETLSSEQQPPKP